MLSYPQHHHRLTRFISDTHLHIPATPVSENHLTTTNTITHDIETGSPRDVTGSTIPSAPLPYLFSPAPFIYCLLFAPSFQALSLTRSLVLPFIYLTACIGYKILFLIALRLTYLILLIAWTLLHSWHTLRLDINFIYTGFHKYSTYKPYTCDLRPTTDPDEYKMNFVSYITTEEDPIHKVTGLRIKRQDLHNEPSEISYLDGHQAWHFRTQAICHL